MNIKNLFVILISVSLFTGCAIKKSEEVVDMSTTVNYEQQVAAYESKFKKYKKIPRENTKSKTFENYTTNNYISKKTTINNNLYDFYSEWEGVRYKMGGESKKESTALHLFKKHLKKNLQWKCQELLHYNQKWVKKYLKINLKWVI